MNWKHGYYADAGYTYGYYPETMPLRLHWAALIQGHQVARQGFRYLDAGCGQGLNLILAAAAHPDSEFVGVDFLPEHIAHARALAKAAGLANVTFIEGDFIQLAHNPAELGEFDYAVCHGISTWIAPEVKSGQFSLIGKVLKPGGVFYNSYNTYPGWLGATPFQHLVLLEQRSKAGSLALQSAREHMERLKTHSAGMMAALPALQTRLKAMETQDPAYLVQEYNNQFWQPVFVSQMMDEMGAVKLSYLGTATLPEAMDAVLAPGVQALLNQQTSAVLKEQLRDYALNQNFRRDLYVKGGNRPWPQAHVRLVRECRFVLNPLATLPEAGQPFQIKGGSVELSGNADFYNSLLNQLHAHREGLTVQALHDATPQAQRGSVMQALSMLLHGGWIYLDQGKPSDPSAAKLNRALAAAVSEGAPYGYLSLPRAGCATVLNHVEWLILDRLYQSPKERTGKVVANALQPQQMASWPAEIAQRLQTLGRTLAKDGQPVTDRSVQQSMLEKSIHDFLKAKWPYAQLMGA